jgi:hypothetical protein
MLSVCPTFTVPPVLSPLLALTAPTAPIVTNPFQPQCSICGTHELLLPCLACGRRQCEDCLLDTCASGDTCEGCRLEHFLSMDGPLEEDTALCSSSSEDSSLCSSDSLEPGLVAPPQPDQRVPWEYGQDTRCPREFVEPGTMFFRRTYYPSEEEWKYTSQVLESHILFTTSDAGPQQPQPYTMYLVGRSYHSSPTSMTTDYMLAYEHHPRNPQTFQWMRYMATYYNKSPMPHEKNVFYPYPLPIQVPRSF